MRPFRLSTVVTLRIGPCLDSAGVEYTGLVIGDLTLTKAGTSAAMAAAATLTHVANGHYSLVTIAGNTDTLGSIRIDCNKATYQIPPVEGEVLPATVYDALVTNATTAAGGLGDVQRIAGTSQTARDIGASVLLSSGTGTGQLDFTAGVVKGNVVQLLGTAWLVPGTAGTPDVNVKLWNALTTVALPLVPTVAGRTLDVSAGGEAGVDWANVGSPTTAVALTNTTISTTQVVASVSGAVGSVTGSVGSVTGSVGSVTAGVTVTTNNDKTGYSLTQSFPANFSALGITAGGHISNVDTLTTYTNDTPQSGDSYTRLGAPAGASIAADLAEIEGETDDIAAVKAKTDQLTFTVALHVDATASIGGNVTVGGYAAGQDPATLVLDTAASGHNTAGSIGQKINSAGAAADPLLNPLPGAYAANTAGYDLYQIFRLMSSGQITLAVPVSTSGTLNLIRGDDYFNVDGRAIEWTDTGSTWPALAGAAIAVKFYQTNFPPAATLSVAGTVQTAGPPGGKVRVELTAAQSALLTKNEYNYFVVATLSDTHVVTIVAGQAIVTGRTP